MLALTNLSILPSARAEDKPEAEAPQKSKIHWIYGPSTADLGDIGKIDVPEGYIFAGSDDTKRIMESMHNPPSGLELGFLTPTNSDWFVVFEFSDTGYVKDDDKDKLDADKLLASIKAGNEAGNEKRKKMGWDTMTIVGWEKPPAYDPETHNLGWAVRATSGSNNEPVVNFNTRILGREGVMKVTLVGDPKELELAYPTFKDLMTKYSFKPGKTYAEYRPGDKIAKYGLTALVVGGGAAALAKTGLFASFFKAAWKFLIVIGAAIASFFKKLFGRKSKDSAT